MLTPGLGLRVTTKLDQEPCTNASERQEYLSADDLVEAGYVQEANRRFFHLLGLELVANVQSDGTLTLKVRDERRVPGGLVFDHREPEWSEVRQARALVVDELLFGAVPHRIERFGFDVQPIDSL